MEAGIGAPARPVLEADTMTRDRTCAPGATRRAFIRRSVAASAAVAAAAGAGGSGAADAPAPGGLPRGRIGDLEISRLILGTNHITYYMHSRDLRYVNDLSRHYNTDAKILDTFAAAEANGIDAFITHAEPKIERLFREHRDRRSGKLKWMLAPWINEDGTRATDVPGYHQAVPRLVDAGADALYVPGMITDRLVREGKGARIGELLAVIAATGLPAGVSCHDLEVVRFCEREKLPVDFYLKTFHHLRYPSAPKPDAIREPHAELPGYWCSNPEDTAECMRGVTRPWIAFKVMAAGAIPPRDAFQHAFDNGADFILAGMFDFQMAEDARIATETLARTTKRARPWHA